MSALILVGLISGLYTAIFGLYQADAKRSSFFILTQKASCRILGRILSGLLLASTLISWATVLGWERGIPVWLGVLSFSGLMHLIISKTMKVGYAYSGLLGISLTIVIFPLHIVWITCV